MIWHIFWIQVHSISEGKTWNCSNSVATLKWLIFCLLLISSLLQLYVQQEPQPAIRSRFLKQEDSILDRFWVVNCRRDILIPNFFYLQENHKVLILIITMVIWMLFLYEKLIYSILFHWLKQYSYIRIVLGIKHWIHLVFPDHP